MYDLLPAKLLLFDFDETLAESERIRWEVRNAFLKQKGMKEISKDEYQQNCVGKSLKLSIAPWLKQTRQTTLTVEEIHDQLKALERAMYRPGFMRPRPGVREFLEIISKKHSEVKMAVCTGADRLDITTKLLSVGLQGYFTEQDMFSRTEAGGFFKPHPGMYWVAYSKYCPGLKAREVRVIEDNQEGVSAGLNGGFPTIATPSIWSKEHDFSGAILAPNGFLDILEYPQYYLGFKL